MRKLREEIGGLGNLLFKEAFIWAAFRDGAIPDIYLQSIKHWEKYREEIRTRFGSGIGKLDMVGIHVRRGDYLKVSQFHTNLWDTDYYRQAVQLFPNEKFIVFCKDNQNEDQDQDDKEWCERNLSQLGINFTMYPHTTETEDLNMMASCKALIGANSSFSWWAAFLGGNPAVFPKAENWFVDGKIRTELLPEWTTL